MYSMASSLPCPFFSDLQREEKCRVEWLGKTCWKQTLDLVSNLNWNRVTQMQSFLSLFEKLLPISFAELSQLLVWLEMEKIYQNIKCI